MKKMLFFLCILPLALPINAQANPPTNSTPAMQQITYNTYNRTTHINITLSPELINKIEAARDSIAHTIQTPFQLAGQLYTWVMDNKIQSSLYLAGAAYAYLHYRLFSLQYQLQAAENWSLWNKVVPLEELFATPQKMLAQTLMHEMQRRYTKADSPNDFFGPMVAFLHAIEQETALLQAYDRLCSWSKTIYISKVVWFDEQLHAACDMRIKRLAYLKSVFVNWIAEYKINVNAPAQAQ